MQQTVDSQWCVRLCEQASTTSCGQLRVNSFVNAEESISEEKQEHSVEQVRDSGGDVDETMQASAERIA